MDDTLHAAAHWLHILGIALFVGPQFFLAAAWVPASRQIDDLPTRVRAMRTITRRFGYLAGIGLLLILVAGLYLILSWRDYYLAGEGEGFYAYRYGVIFTVKMAILAVMLVLLVLHIFVVGPRLLALLEAQASGEPVADSAIRKARLQSMALSIGALLLALIIMALGATLATYTFSMKEV